MKKKIYKKFLGVYEDLQETNLMFLKTLNINRVFIFRGKTSGYNAGKQKTQKLKELIDRTDVLYVYRIKKNFYYQNMWGEVYMIGKLK